MGFVHLHVHSHLSLLDATIRPDKLADRVAKLGMDAVALTDHGNLFAAVQFMKACKTAHIKPIFGAEVLVRDPKGSARNHHLVLLCRNEPGFAHLRTIISRSYIEGLREGKPTTTRDVIAENAGGLVALSGCLGGEVPHALLRGDRAAALEALEFHRNAFGPDGFYLELQANELVEQDRANEALIALGRETGTPLVATSNAHYMLPEDAVAHAVLVAIEMKRTVTEEMRRTLPLRSFHLWTPEQMAARFAHVPDALENTQKIADSVETGVLKQADTLHFPVFETPHGETTAQFLTDLAQRGVEARLEHARSRGEAVDPAVYQARLDRELGVIIRLKFDAYYLIVWDFINWAKEHGVPVGPGRGSGAGSLVAFAIGVTDIDPIKYVLLFERFLNPERVNPPDFDIDFCQDKRDRVIDYVTQKYGRERVGQIITYNAMKAKAVVRDVTRVLGGTFQQGDVLARLIPAELDMTLDKAIAQSTDLQKLIKDDPFYGEIWDIARRLEGLNRQAGKHAAGVVIADRPIAEYSPLFMTEDGAVVTQFNMKDLDTVGLIKFDFLGLTALTVIDKAVHWILERHDPAFRLEDIPTQDRATFEQIGAGRNAGVFQLETRGITDLVRRLKPDSIEDITAAIALFRPGPLGSGMVEDFIARKHGLKPVEYLLPQLEEILRDTYGTILYQEQVMLIASHLAGFTLGQADMLRRAMGKKKPEELEAQRVPFVQGSSARGVPAARANEIFEILLKFADYGFNKSHSAAYAVVGYRMAWLKTHYPTEFLAAVLCAEKGDQEKIMRFMHEARACGIAVLPPDVLSSDADFSVQDVITPDGQKQPAIRFGLTAVKGIGESAVSVIVAAREAGPFKNLLDFLTRIDLRKVNRRTIETLARCGALACFGHSRAALLNQIERLLDLAQSRKAERDSGQMGLFGGPADPSAAGEVTGPDPEPEWPVKDLLTAEREMLGCYVSGHPLDPYQQDLAKQNVTPILELASRVGDEAMVAGVVVQASEKTTKSGNQPFAFLTLEDSTGQVECMVGTKTHDQWKPLQGLNEPLLVRGKVTFEGDEEDVLRVTVNSIQRLETARGTLYKGVQLRVDVTAVREAALDTIRTTSLRHKGRSPLFLLMRLPGVGEMLLRAGSQWSVDPSDATLADFAHVLGPENVGLL